MQKRKSSRIKNYPHCAICNCRPDLTLTTAGKGCYLCSYCDSYFFDDLFSVEAKLDRLVDGMRLAQEKRIDIGFALNVLKGRYSLSEAKKRHALKHRELTGKSVDIFTVGKRMPGGYR